MDGTEFPLEADSGKELIDMLMSDDWGAPPTGMVISATSQDGREVIIIVPYDERDSVRVVID